VQQITSLWATLDLKKRVIVGVATFAMFLAIIGMSRMAASPNLTLLYAGLESSSAGDVVKALETRGVAYEIRGGAIFVDSSNRDSLRMTLASEGLPANSGKGYELLDGLSGFGTTSQMFDAAYWRAKEGELARTIVASPLIQNARVHIGNVASNRFRQRNEPTASVTVTTANGALPPAQAKALKFLVASAVAGLSPDSVSVIDSRGGLVASGDDLSDLPGAVSDRAAQLKQNIERLLEARVGFGNAVVELNLETVTEQESILERRFDPEGRVAVSTDTQETTRNASDSASGGVTVASNLPDGDGADETGSSSSNNSENRERINYEISETTREVVKTPGAVKRLTVAVLVDGIRVADENGVETWQPRSEDELSSLRALVAGAVGFDETRGDQITIKTMEFDVAPTEGSAGPSGWASGIDIDVMTLLQIAVLAFVVLILGLFVLRPILLAQSAAAGMSHDQQIGAGNALPGPSLPTEAPPELDFSAQEGLAELPALSGEIESDAIAVPEMAVVSDIDFGNDMDPTDPVQRLRDLISERQTETVEILRGWMEEDEEPVR